MVETTFKEVPPSGVKLEVTAIIDQKVWAELQNQGWTEKDITKAIKNSITFKDIVGGGIPKVPLWGIIEVELLKYY